MKGRARREEKERERKRKREEQRTLVEREGGRSGGVLAMLSTLEGELPRTRGPNPLFWTHTLAHLSLTPNHLQLTLSPHPFPASRTSLSYLLPPFLPSTALRLLPQWQTRHIARSVALLPR